MMMVVYSEILYEVAGPVAVITLNRPAQLNAWTDRMGKELRHAVDRAEHDPAVVGIVLTGAGRAFCAGADMQGLQSLSSGGRIEPSDTSSLEVTRAEALPEDFDGGYTWLLAVPKPVIAAINGPVAGMAVPIALCCDLRFMATDAPLVTAFSQRGLIAEWGISWLLGRLVGPGHALDLLFSSRRVSGEEAAGMGLVNKALPAEEVLAHSVHYVEELAARCSPASLAVMKRQVYDDLSLRLGEAEKRARQLMVDSFERPDFREGVASFTEKRPPSFTRLGAPSEP